VKIGSVTVINGGKVLSGKVHEDPEKGVEV
jgi:hypothetical protein